ncbi:ATP-dependent zinc metalloprotease FtsH [Salisediminibacterium beveridgei]|uniref:ATP-dependent zinc metalloprotease FtsH n=1 Tax=Salisediminibacterium beveridgei TaxID=632773 RepID=A0A1D7R035_9BACI|nr:ATP-dependent zinc metalloprotease FtsH [Salisediminibacterium beveridgei]AOM84609.1 Cell division protein FtsH [Salisediminibacterium beveridgei]
MNRIFRNTLFYLLIFLVIVGIVSVFSQEPGDTSEITFTEFKQEYQEGNVESLEIQPNLDVYSARGQFTDAEEDEFFTVNIPDLQVFLEDIVAASGSESLNELTIEPAEEPSGWITFFTVLIPFIIIFILFFFLISQSQGGGNKMMNFGKSKAKLVSEEKKKARFKDVAGADEEKQELVEVVDFLKEPRKFAEIGARIPKGVLLVGPPGTGKTLIARAVAGEAGVPFFSISGSDFVEMFVGVGASRVRDLFENAKKNSPCIIFIDEIDAVGRRRGAGVGGGHDEREQTLNQLLVEMDGFGVNEGIILIAATNRADILDPALLRPGRFDRQIMVGRPDVKGREAVLEVHAKDKPLSDDVQLKTIAQRTPGFSGADLENLLNEAALVAARTDKKKIDMESVEEAIDRTIAGPSKKTRVISEKEKKIVAHHEAGHTVVGVKLVNADMVHKVTIVPRGQAGGYAMMLPREDRYFMTKPELIDKIIGLLGGRVAEEVMFNEVSTGAHNDFQRATGIARKMVMEYGMSEKLGPIQFGSSQGEVFLGRDINNEQNYSEAIAYEIDMEVQRIIKEAYASCKEILVEHKDKLELVAEMLMEIETLDAEQIYSLVEDGKMPENHHMMKKLNGEKENSESDEENQEEKNAEEEPTDGEQADAPAGEEPKADPDADTEKETSDDTSDQEDDDRK